MYGVDPEQGLTRRAVLSLFPAALLGPWLSLRSGRASPTQAPATEPIASSPDSVPYYEYLAYEGRLPELEGQELVTLESTYFYDDDGQLVSFTAEPAGTVLACPVSKATAWTP